MFKRIIAAACLPLALIMLVTGFSPVSKEKQEKLNKETEENTQKDFVPVFRFAVATDVHINAEDNTTTERFKKLFESAYRYSDSHPSYNSLDALVLTGDNCDNGADAEYEILKSVLSEYKRDETEFVAVLGNHEFHETGREGFVRNLNMDLEPHVVIKGYHFIGLSPNPSDTWQMPSQLIWMSRELKKAEKDDPEKPIFTMQHGHIWNTVYVSKSWSTQASLPLHLIYSKYPQVINFSGHSHGPVNNPKSIWQNSYTQVGAGTLNFFEMERDIGDNTIPEGSRNAAQYLIVEVDAENRVRIMPYNILTDDFMKTAATTDDPEKQLIWQIENPSDPSTYAYTSARKKVATAPWFGENDEAAAEEIGADKVTLTFPQANSDECVYGYRINIAAKDSPRKKITKEVYSEYYFEPMPETLSVTVEGLKAGKEYTAEIIPLDVWLQTGEPLLVSFTTPD